MEYFITFVFYSLIIICIPRLFKEAMLCKDKKKKGYYIFWFLSILILLSLVACFRGKTGTDSNMYASLYKRQQFIRGVSSDFELGYVMICKVLYSLRLPYQALFFTMSFLQSFFVFKVIEYERHAIDVRLVAFVYLASIYLASFNVMRQSLAVAICLYAIVIYLDKKIIKSFVLIILATQIHSTAFIVFGIIFAKFVFDKKSKILMALIFSVGIYFVFNREILNEIYKMITGHYTGYLGRDVETDGSLFGYVIKLSPILLLMILSYKEYLKNRRYLTYFGLTISGEILGMLEYFTNTQVGRIGWYFSYLNMIVLGYIAQSGLKMRKDIYFSPKMISLVIYSYSYVIFVYNFAIKNFGELFPYHGFF